MDSTPPAMNTSPSPAPIAWAAAFTAWSPDPHSRLTVWPATSTGRPASSAAIRATLRLSSPAWFAQPRITSSTSAGVDPGPVDDRADDDGGEVVGADGRERAAVAPDRGADGVDDPGLAEGSVEVSGHAPDCGTRRTGNPAAVPRVRHPCRRRHACSRPPPSSLAALVAACGGSAAAPPTGGSAAPATPAAATAAADADHIDHPTGPTDIVLRVAEEGGFMMMETVMARVPRFTLYGDGRVLISTPAEAAKAAPGNGLPAEVLRETHLTEDEVQAVLRSALVDGKVGIAKEEFPVMVMDVPTTVIELQAGGVDKQIAVAGLGMEPPPGPDAAVLTRARRARRAARRDPDRRRLRGARLGRGPRPDGTRAGHRHGATGRGPRPRPRRSSSRRPTTSSGSRPTCLTAAESEAIGTAPGDAAGPFTYDGPDGKTYVVVVRPAMPEEAAA